MIRRHGLKPAKGHTRPARNTVRRLGVIDGAFAKQGVRPAPISLGRKALAWAKTTCLDAAPDEADMQGSGAAEAIGEII